MKSFFYHKNIFLLSLLLISSPIYLLAQPAEQKLQLNLAKQYFQNEEYDKALPIYEELYNADKEQVEYFNAYLQCLIQMDKNEEAEKVINKTIKKNPQDWSLYLLKGNFYAKQNRDKEAQEAYDKPLSMITAKQVHKVGALAESYIAIDDYDRALRAYEIGREELKDPSAFYLELGQLYQRKGDKAKMTENYLYLLEKNPEQIQSVKSNIQLLLEDEGYAQDLKKQLYNKIQEKPDMMVFPELLVFLFNQQKDFYNALLQAKSIDKRMKENGSRIYAIAKSAQQEKDYESAIEGFQYILEKGPEMPLYVPSYSELLATQKEKILQTDYSVQDLQELNQNYTTFLQDHGIDNKTAATVRDQAMINALYKNNLDTAIIILTSFIENNAVDPAVRADAKLDLGDYYLMQDNIYDSYIYYAQVDKAYKDGPLGEMARFKNAKLSYYNGDFEWAQGQLTVLKASTSELIANDALDLSIFIQDNTGTDTVFDAMKMFAKADLLLYQNKISETEATLDSIETLYPNHKLTDDIFFVKAKIEKKQRHYTEAIQYLQDIIKNYDDGILADDALYMMAEIYQYKLNDLENAKAMYEKIILDKSDSVYSVEARKRFRALRGDKI